MAALKQKFLDLGIELRDPASAMELARCEAGLGGQSLHNDLLFILGEVSNGMRRHWDELLWGAVELGERNLEMRTWVTESGCYMPFEPLQFFRDMGNGDLVGLPVVAEVNSSVFLWDHEQDSRTWVAPDLATYFEWSVTNRLLS